MPREATQATTLIVQGTEIPKLGFGTWQITGDACAEAVRDALELGYRHIDTARAYGNEAQVGRGIERSGVERGSIFLTTKLWHTGLRAGQVREQLEGSLRDLAVDHVNLLLVHWPSRDVPLAETLGAMTELQEEGKASHLGVSNFPSRLVEEALQLAPIICDQVEYHPYLGQPQVLATARERDLVVTAYSPLARGEVHRDPVLAEIGEAHGKSPGQVVLRWLLDQPHVAAVPKASSHEHRAANLDVFDFELGDDERGRIAGLERGLRAADPSWAADWD
ncbi:MAG: 2,5-diketo-D-gluconate reductase [Solirubrobacteraceae bacterium]|jgi:2,5-diketo-D-gluconate reductase B|nr:2,5-diketo-D-gluconate reductase [Solirubrobacteraceae bacterium]